MPLFRSPGQRLAIANLRGTIIARDIPDGIKNPQTYRDEARRTEYEKRALGHALSLLRTQRGKHAAHGDPPALSPTTS